MRAVEIATTAAIVAASWTEFMPGVRGIAKKKYH
jgi:hypothetical protein